MRNLICKSTFSVLMLFAVLASVVRLNLVFASTPVQKAVSFEQFSYPKQHKHFTSYITELKEYTIENGEELDDEADDKDELPACIYRHFIAYIFSNDAETGKSLNTLVLSDNFSRKNALPLFIEFENFRL